jgi:phosphoglycolate phosphatase-like HAD superfamily hydrolase
MTVTPASIVREIPETLVLWDVDHTLIENGGVSKAMYATAFELLIGRSPDVRPATDGRTDFQIMRELLAANSVDVTGYVDVSQFEDALVRAMEINGPDLPRLGYVLPGVIDAINALTENAAITQSVLTGNIAPNARAKIAPFGLDKLLDLEIGGFGSDDKVRSNLVDASRRKVKDKYGRSFDSVSTILIGDTLLDVKAAHDGGAKVIAVATGVYSVEQLAETGPDATLANLADLEEFLRVLLGVRTNGSLTA